MSEHKYSFVDEKDDHFVISHPSEGQFKVAKKGINKVLQKKIKGLPKAMDEGGEVTDEDAADQDASNDLWNPKEYRPLESGEQPDKPWNQDLPYPLGGGIPSGPGNPELSSILPKHLPYPAGPGLYANLPGDEDKSNPDIKKAAWEKLQLDEKQNKEVQDQLPAAQQQPQQPQMANMSAGPFDAQYNQIKSGMMAESNAKSAEQLAVAKAIQENADIQTKQAQDHKAITDKIMSDQDQMTQAYANGKIDPNRMWHDMPTENKIAAAIGIFLGSMGSAYTGGPNQALAILNKTMEQDIDAQKADLGKKQTLLSMNLRKYGDINAAYQATKMDQNSALIAKLQGIEATTNSVTTKAKTQQMIGQLSLQQKQQSMQFGQSMFMRSIATGQTPIAANQINAIPDKDLRDRAVAVPGQTQAYFAANDKDAEKIKDMNQKAMDVENSIKMAEDFQKTHGTTYIGMNNDNAKRIQKELQEKLTNFMDVSRGMTMEQKSELGKIAESPGAFRQDNAAQSFKNIRAIVNSGKTSTYRAMLPSFRQAEIKDDETKGRVK